MSERGARFQLDQHQYPGVSVTAEVIEDRVTITEVTIRRPEGVTVADLRSVPLSRIEAAWNDPANTDAKLVRQRLRWTQVLKDAAPKPPTRRELRLAIPSERRYPDAFYVAVAGLYRRLVANGVRPAPALADANDVPVTTVHAWVKEARARGLLAPARAKGATG